MDSKIILVHYINFGENTRPDKFREQMALYRHRVLEPLEVKHEIINLVLPLKGEQSRIECINPQLVTDEVYQKALGLVKESEEYLEKWRQDNPLT